MIILFLNHERSVRKFALGVIMKIKNNGQVENLKFSKRDPKKLLSPFIHKFKTKDNYYIYDVNTSEILKVDETLWDIVEDYKVLSKNEIVNKYLSKYSEDEISTACYRIFEAQQKQGLFLPNRPEVKIQVDKDSAFQFLNTNRDGLILNVTESCNFRCLYCPYTIESSIERNHSNKMMSWDVAKHSIDDFFKHSENSFKEDTPGPAISFYGGEPLLNISLIKKCVKYIYKNFESKKVMFSITTNGSLLNGDIADFLASHNFSITVSLDGPKNIHDQNRLTVNSSKTWELVTRNIKDFLDNNYDNSKMLNINAVLPSNADALEFEKYLTECELLRNVGAVKIIIVRPQEMGAKPDSTKENLPQNLGNLESNFLNNLKSGKMNVNTREYQIQRSLFELFYLQIHKRSYGFAKHRHFSDIYPLKLSTCIPGVRRTFVTCDGDYYPCERIPACEELKIGDAYNGMNNEKSYALYQRFFDCNKNQCKYCWCIRMCHIGCFQNVREQYAVTTKAKQDACEGHRSITSKLLANYCDVLEKNPNAFDYMKKIEVV